MLILDDAKRRHSTTIQILRKSIKLFKKHDFKLLADYLIEEHNYVKPNSAAVGIFINKLYLAQNQELKKAAKWIVFHEVYVTWPHFERHYDGANLAERKVFYCNELKEYYKECLDGMELEFRAEFDALDAEAKATQESKEYLDDLLNDSSMKADNVIASIPMELGGDVAETLVPKDYEGPCRMYFTGLEDEAFEVFPTVKDSYAAAKYALQPDCGGYRDVYVTPAPGETPTFQSWQDWAFE